MKTGQIHKIQMPLMISYEVVFKSENWTKLEWDGQPTLYITRVELPKLWKERSGARLYAQLRAMYNAFSDYRVDIVYGYDYLDIYCEPRNPSSAPLEGVFDIALYFLPTAEASKDYSQLYTTPIY